MDSVILEKQDQIAILSLNRPDKMNPLGSLNDGEEFSSCCDEINQDENIRCAVITGKGKAFSAGGDLNAMVQKTGIFSGSGIQLRENYRAGIHKVVKALWNLEIPLIAAINGHAIGLGNDIAMTADIRIASDTAKFGASFVNIGLVPGDGGAWLLPRTIGRSRAAELFFTGDYIDAATALEWGLVSYVEPQSQVMEKSLAIARKICSKPPLPIRMTKQMIRKADTDTLDTILQMACGMQALLHETEDHKIAVQALINKMEANYTGK